MRLTVLAVVVLALGGCKKDEPPAAVTLNVGGAKLTTDGKGAMKIDDGKGNTAVVGAQVPKDFPLPLFESAGVAMATKTEPSEGETAYAVTYAVKGKTPKEVATFYEQALKDKGLTTTKNEVNLGELSMVQMAGEKDGVVAGVVVTPGDEGNCSVQLTWQNKAK